MSSVIRGRDRGGARWGSSGGLLSPAPPLLTSSPTRCLCRSLYGALKFLMKASKEEETNRILILDPAKESSEVVILTKRLCEIGCWTVVEDIMDLVLQVDYSCKRAIFSLAVLLA